MVVLTKVELLKKLLENTKIKKDEAMALIEAFFAEICEALQKGEEVKLSGFGCFRLRQKKERPGRNPKTGEAAVIKARRVVTFHPSQKLKARIVVNKSK